LAIPISPPISNRAPPSTARSAAARPDVHGRGELDIGHGRLACNVGGARGDSLGANAGDGPRILDRAEIQDLHPRVERLNQDRDRRPAGRDVAHHLIGHGLRKGRDTLRCNPVIRSEQQNLYGVGRGGRRPLKTGETNRDLFETTE
jgi:hypothetical protein